ncbi:MAG: hypothetical protein JW754_02590 [Candidatus Aenigmarchaeota archaeon]|nr:hypothetical protein [Candidatus Aenigmarchaeota archaeon]
MNFRLFSIIFVFLFVLPVLAQSLELAGFESFPVFLEAGKPKVLDATGPASVMLEVSVKENVIDGVVSVASYTENPVEYGVEGKKSAKFIGVHVSDDIYGSLEYIDLEIHYNEDDVAGEGIDENTLRIYEWNVMEKEWRMVSTELDLHNNILRTRIKEPGMLSVYGKEFRMIDEKCLERWICSDWGECMNGVRDRICEDISGCGTQDDKPEEFEDCVVEIVSDDNQPTGMIITERTNLLVVGVVIFLVIVLAVLIYLFMVTVKT